MPTSTRLLTAEEFAQLPNENGEVRELVRGQVIIMNQPFPRHGQVCAEIVFELKAYLRVTHLGHVVSNDSGIRTESNPDTVRGGDVSYIGFDKVAPGPLPQGYLDAVPDIVFEVLSPSDRKGTTLQKVGEYLLAGVGWVCVVHPGRETITVHHDDEETILRGDDLLVFPDLLPGFAVPVGRFFGD